MHDDPLHGPSAITRRTALAALGASGLGVVFAAHGLGRAVAQDATPTASADHPLVGTWIVDTDVDYEADAPAVTVFGADGTAAHFGAQGATGGAAGRGWGRGSGGRAG